jgi:4-hydroxy-3-methylbut-2-enyl diphosphate reductase
LIDGAEDIRPEWLVGKESIGVTAGASAPEVLVEGVITHLQAHGAKVKVQDSGITENVSFVLPKALRRD